MSGLDACSMGTTFLLWSALVWRMFATPAPSPSIGCRFRWTMWGILHAAAAIGAMAYLIENWSAPRYSAWHLCLMRASIAALILYRWRRREDTAR